MLRNYLKIAWRNLINNKVFSLINIFGLAIGLACSILILLWVEDELKFDKFHISHERIYRVLQDMPFTEKTTWAITQGPLGKALMDEIPEIEKATSTTVGRWRIKYEDKDFSELALYGDTTFFEMFTFEMVQGNIKSALSEPNSVVVTETAAQRIFGDVDPIGETITVYDDFEIIVTGIIKDVPVNSHIVFDLIGTMEFAKNIGYSIDRWNNSGFGTYVMIPENTSLASIGDKIYDFLDNKPTLEEGAKLRLQPLTEIHLSSGIDFNDQATGNVQYVVIFFASALFILIIACINFMNLSTAQATKRAREVGLRKSIGAGRFQLIYQFIMESVMLALFAFSVSLLLVESVLPIFNEFSGKQLSIDYDQPTYIFGFIGLLILTGLIAGSYPAFVLSSFTPVNVLKGGSIKPGGYSGLRKVMVVIQCTISVILLIGTMAVYTQVDYLVNKDLGYDKENLLYLQLNPDIVNHLEATKNEFLSYNNILKVAGSGPLSGYWWSNNQWTWEGKGPGNDILFRGASVDHGYHETMGIEMIAGREFSLDFPSDTLAVVLNEKAIELMGLEDPVGKSIITTNDHTALEIIGVSKNYNFRSLYSEIEPLLLTYRPKSSNYLFLRIREENIDETISFVESKWKELSPGNEVKYGFLDDRFANRYMAEQRIGTVLNAFSVLALIVLCLGLFGLLGFSVTQRYKEISIRKIFGANTSLILLLLSKDYTKLLLIAIVLAIPISNYLITDWLSSFPYQVDLPTMIFIVPACILLMVSLLIIMGQAYKATKVNAASTLRGE